MAKNLSPAGRFQELVSADHGQWVLVYLDRAESLLNECRRLASDSYDDNIDDIEPRLKSLTASLQDNIQIWQKYIHTPDHGHYPEARRMLARSYLKAADGTNDEKEQQQFFIETVNLMEENIPEDQQNVENIRIWFDTILKIKNADQESVILDAISKLNKWIELSDAPEAYYYRFVVLCLQANEGSIFAESELPKLLRDLRNRTANKYNRTQVQHWLGNKGEGLQQLISIGRHISDRNFETAMKDALCVLQGRISENYVNDSHAYIRWKGIDVFFNPSATHGIISRTSINQMVQFGMGFSYDGPRAFNSSIKLLGKTESADIRRTLAYGSVVKCEVIKNIDHYVQVRILDNAEKGSIPIDELSAPYSSGERPRPGTILECKVLTKHFVSARNCEVWSLTTNLEDIDEDNEGLTLMQKALYKSGVLKT